MNLLSLLNKSTNQNCLVRDIKRIYNNYIFMKKIVNKIRRG